MLAFTLDPGVRRRAHPTFDLPQQGQDEAVPVLEILIEEPLFTDIAAIQD
jgi:hypothetical protein